MQCRVEGGVPFRHASLGFWGLGLKGSEVRSGWTAGVRGWLSNFDLLTLITTYRC